MDNKSVLFMSSAHAVEPSDECRRWSKKENQHIQVKRPFVVKSRKWTVRTIIHLFDVAAVSSWLQFRDDERMKGEWENTSWSFWHLRSGWQKT